MHELTGKLRRLHPYTAAIDHIQQSLHTMAFVVVFIRQRSPSHEAWMLTRELWSFLPWMTGPQATLPFLAARSRI